MMGYDIDIRNNDRVRFLAPDLCGEPEIAIKDHGSNTLAAFSSCRR